MSHTSRPGLTLLRKEADAKWREQRAEMQAAAPQPIHGSGLMSRSNGSVATARVWEPQISLWEPHV